MKGMQKQAQVAAKPQEGPWVAAKLQEAKVAVVAKKLPPWMA